MAGRSAALLPAILALLLAPTPGLTAGTVSAGISVGATVRPAARIEAPPAVGLTVSAEDIRRGYVDVPAAESLAIWTNSRDGYSLRLDIDTDLAWLTEVRGLARQRLLGPGGGRIKRATPGLFRERLTLGWRFYLSEDVRPGIHDWPVRYSVTPCGR